MLSDVAGSRLLAMFRYTVIDTSTVTDKMMRSPLFGGKQNPIAIRDVIVVTGSTSVYM